MKSRGRLTTPTLQSIEVDNKTKVAFTRHDPIGVCGQMWVSALEPPPPRAVLSADPRLLAQQHPMELPYQHVVRPRRCRRRAQQNF